ncbi:CYTH and CHAD domain-containing protein [Solirubrobacter soli]|uniref:CYTH and CHAD domain-containing protein n=1 Tax=Solirubrobacter soli TaxID=363832 RepID=UPI000406C5EF|nr:CHAD domain-containing protein [Solirubrobacter soli]
MAVVTHLLPEGADLNDARTLIKEHVEVTSGRIRAGTSTFYDTFDGRLHAAGVTLHHIGGRLTLTDRETGETLATSPAPARAEHRLFDHDLADGLNSRLADVIEMRALTPVAKVRTREITLGVLNADQKTVVRLNVATHEGLRGRVRATAVRGYDKDLEQVDALLRDGLSLPEATVPLVDEAVAATGKPADGTSAKLNLHLDPEEPASEAAATVFARLLEVIDENFPGTLEDVDSEFLHDLRVAVRRTRSLQRQFKAIYPERLQHHREEFKRIQAITSDLRDLDVYLLDFPALKASLPAQMQPDLDPLKTLLETKRAKALTQTRRALKAERTQAALKEWGEFTHATYASKQTVKALASHRITSVYKQMVKMGTAIDDESPAEDLHELRKVGKELRYLLEFFASLYPVEVGKPFVKSLKGLQDQLGRFQDHEVQANKLRELAPEVSNPMTLMAMGVLVDRFIKDEALARLEFADRFAVFASDEQRAIVKEHFAK